MSHGFARDSPRSSMLSGWKALVGSTHCPPVPRARLVAASAIVSVDPPLSVSGPSSGSAPIKSRAAAEKPHCDGVVDSRLRPLSVTAATSQLGLAEATPEETIASPTDRPVAPAHRFPPSLAALEARVTLASV